MQGHLVGCFGRSLSPVFPPSSWKEQGGRVTQLLKAWSSTPEDIFIDSVAGMPFFFFFISPLQRLFWAHLPWRPGQQPAEPDPSLAQWLLPSKKKPTHPGVWGGRRSPLSAGLHGSLSSLSCRGQDHSSNSLLLSRRFLPPTSHQEGPLCL